MKDIGIPRVLINAVQTLYMVGIKLGGKTDGPFKTMKVLLQGDPGHQHFKMFMQQTPQPWKWDRMCSAHATMCRNGREL